MWFVTAVVDNSDSVIEVVISMHRTMKAANAECDRLTKRLKTHQAKIGGNRVFSFETSTVFPLEWKKKEGFKCASCGNVIADTGLRVGVEYYCDLHCYYNRGGNNALS